MKKIHLIFVMMLASSSLFSQTPRTTLVSTSLVTNNIRKINYQFQTTNSRGKNLQYGGIALAAGGTCLMLAGIAMIMDADGETSYNYSTTTNGGTSESGSLEGGLGAVMVAGGAVMSAGGIVMIYFGQKRIKREKARGNLSFSPLSTKLIYHF